MTMAVEFVRPVSHTAFWARRLALFALMLAIAAWTAIRFGPLLEPHFLAIYAAACFLACLSLLGALVGFVNLWRVGARGGKASVAAVFLAVPVLLPLAYAGFAWQSHPKIYEVTTDPVDPPEWIAHPRHNQFWLGPRVSAGEADRAAQSTFYPALITHRYDAGLDRVVKAVRKAAEARHIRLTDQKVPSTLQPDEADAAEAAPVVPGGIPVPKRRPDFVPGAEPAVPEAPIAIFQGVTADRLLGFPFDVVIRVREDGDNTLADIRVAARYGASDLGGSAKIAAAFLNALDEAMMGAADE